MCKFSSFNLQKNAVRFGSGLSHFSAHLNWVIPCWFKPYLQISILHFYRSYVWETSCNLGKMTPGWHRACFHCKESGQILHQPVSGESHWHLWFAEGACVGKGWGLRCWSVTVSYCYHGKSGDGVSGSSDEQRLCESLRGAAHTGFVRGSGKSSQAAWQLLVPPWCIYDLPAYVLFRDQLSPKPEILLCHFTECKGKRRKMEMNIYTFRWAMLPLAPSSFKWTSKNAWNEPPQGKKHISRCWSLQESE